MSNNHVERGVLQGSAFSIGIDIGGTFTDCAVVDDFGRVYTAKVLTTPEDLSTGFFAAIRAGAEVAGLSEQELLSRTTRLSHGTTVGINALVSRTGVTVGLIATSGHGDLLKIMDNTGRVTGASVDEILDYAASTIPESFVADGLIREIAERIDFAGEVVVDLDEDGVRAAIASLVDNGVQALAVALLWSHVNPAHELRVRELAEEVSPQLFVTCSHRTAPRIGEYPRAATAVMNSYIGPIMANYVDRIVAGASERGYAGEVLFASCEGGLIDLATVRELPILTLQSGPVGGVLAAGALDRQLEGGNIITMDMGGTSLDVSVIEGGRVFATDEAIVERHQLHLRKVDVESIGAGGGSIGWIDPRTGGLRVGPQSAGAVPGPASYGRGGTEPTITDANLAVGFLDPSKPLAGGLRLDRAAALDALARVGEPLGLGPVETAGGMLALADSMSEDLLRRVTLQKGRDPRDFSGWGLGGAAGLHVATTGRNLGLRSIVIPLNTICSVWSAYGIARAKVTRTFERAVHLESPTPASLLRAYFAELEAEARAYLARVLGADASGEYVATLDMKYAMQWYTVEVDVSAEVLASDDDSALTKQFERTYERRYGRDAGYSEAGTVISALRVTATATDAGPPAEPAPSTDLPASSVTADDTRSVYWYDRAEYVDTPVYRGAGVAPGTVISGPAIVDYDQTTVVVREQQQLTVDPTGNLVIRWQLDPMEETH